MTQYYGITQVFHNETHESLGYYAYQSDTDILLQEVNDDSNMERVMRKYKNEDIITFKVKQENGERVIRQFFKLGRDQTNNLIQILSHLI